MCFNEQTHFLDKDEFDAICLTLAHPVCRFHIRLVICAFAFFGQEVVSNNHKTFHLHWNWNHLRWLLAFFCLVAFFWSTKTNMSLLKTESVYRERCFWAGAKIHVCDGGDKIRYKHITDQLAFGSAKSTPTKFQAWKANIHCGTTSKRKKPTNMHHQSFIAS